jgi:hypothetical protein
MRAGSSLHPCEASRSPTIAFARGSEEAGPSLTSDIGSGFPFLARARVMKGAINGKPEQNVRCLPAEGRDTGVTRRHSRSCRNDSCLMVAAISRIRTRNSLMKRSDQRRVEGSKPRPFFKVPLRAWITACLCSSAVYIHRRRARRLFLAIPSRATNEKPSATPPCSAYARHWLRESASSEKQATNRDCHGNVRRRVSRARFTLSDSPGYLPLNSEATRRVTWNAYENSVESLRQWRLVARSSRSLRMPSSPSERV